MQSRNLENIPMEMNCMRHVIGYHVIHNLRTWLRMLNTPLRFWMSGLVICHLLMTKQKIAKKYAITQRKANHPYAQKRPVQRADAIHVYKMNIKSRFPLCKLQLYYAIQKMKKAAKPVSRNDATQKVVFMSPYLLASRHLSTQLSLSTQLRMCPVPKTSLPPGRSSHSLAPARTATPTNGGRSPSRRQTSRPLASRARSRG